MPRAHEQPAVVPKSPEFGEVEATDLYRALTHPSFVRGVRSVGRHTRRTGIEAGLAVYKNGPVLSVSPPLLPTSESLRSGDLIPRAFLPPTGEAVKEGYEGFSMQELLTREDEKGDRYPRDDVLLAVHSHNLEGLFGREQSADMLCPSLGDLEGFEKAIVRMPDVTEGILVPSKEGIDLLLYKKSPTRDYQQFYKRFTSTPNRQKFLDSLREGGLNLAQLRVTNDPEYPQHVAEAVAILNS